MNELYIKYQPTTDPTTPDLLTGFPFLSGQSVTGGEDEELADSLAAFVYIDLADRDDTTVAQEFWLDTNPRIIDYGIR